MLVVLIVIQVSSVLLNTRINPQRSRIRLLNPEIIRLKLPINLTLLLSILISNPHTLNILTTNNVVPMGVRTTSVLLGQ